MLLNETSARIEVKAVEAMPVSSIIAQPCERTILYPDGVALVSCAAERIYCQSDRNRSIFTRVFVK
jgi:hypothetical protein